MPRHARQESSTGFYHIMIRGINRDFFFQRDSEKQHFLDLLQEQQMATRFSIAAWCIMDNHVHLIVKGLLPELSKGIKVICMKFAARYNKVTRRTGPVFGDRFRSENIEDENYLLSALRYVHLNPVKGHITANPGEFLWSSYREYIGEPSYIDPDLRDFVLSLLGKEPHSFVRFHAQDDGTEHLENPEDVVNYRMDRANKLIEAFCRARGIIARHQIRAHPEAFADACALLTHKGKLTLRQTAVVLESNHQKVHYALKQLEE